MPGSHRPAADAYRVHESAAALISGRKDSLAREARDQLDCLLKPCRRAWLATLLNDRQSHRHCLLQRAQGEFQFDGIAADVVFTTHPGRLSQRESDGHI